MTRFKTVPYAAGLAAALMLSGCQGGSPDPTPSTTTTSQVTTSATAPATTTVTAPPTTTAGPAFPPGLPAAAKAHTKAGAKAFVEYFVAQVNRSWTLPDPERLTPLCALKPGDTCSNWQADAKELLAKGLRYEADPLSVRDVASMGDLQGHSRLLLSAVQNPVGRRNKSGPVGPPDARKDLRLQVFLDWTPTGWRVLNVESVG